MTARKLLTIVFFTLGLGGMARASDRCPCGEPKVCCPVEQTKKVATVSYSEDATEVCFPPGPWARLKKRLGIGAGGCPCEGCCGHPRIVHHLLKRTVTEEKCGEKYDPAVPCALPPCESK